MVLRFGQLSGKSVALVHFLSYRTAATVRKMVEIYLINLFYVEEKKTNYTKNHFSINRIPLTNFAV